MHKPAWPAPTTTVSMRRARSIAFIAPGRSYSCAPARLQDQHAVAEQVELVPAFLEDLGVAAHDEVLAGESRGEHDVTGPRPVQVCQQCIHDLELESGVYVQIGPRRPGHNGGAALVVDCERFEGSQDRRADCDDAPPLGYGPADLRCGLGADLEKFLSHLVVLDLFLADMSDRENLCRSHM